MVSPALGGLAVIAAMGLQTGPGEGEAMATIRLDPETWLERIDAQPEGPRFIQADSRDGLDTLLYAPRGHDPQSPHRRDEIYVVVRGTGKYTVAGEAVSFAPGDVLFAPAHAEHRFEAFSDDLAVWVFFYGPEHDEPDEGTADN